MTKNLYIVLAVVIAVAVGIFVFFGRPSNVSAPVPTTSPSTTPVTEEPPAVSGVEPPSTAVVPRPTIENAVMITYGDSGFSPAALTVKAGIVVTFQNKGSSPFWPASAIHPTHAVYDGTTMSEHCQNGTSDTFDACKGITPGSSWSFKFDKVGSWKYHDHLNPGRTGTVVVE